MTTNTHYMPGFVLTDHSFTLPLNHSRPGGEQITVFAREIVAAGKEEPNLPWLVFFQGGPGFPAPRPPANSGWLKRATQDYRMLLLDPRGTGRSTPVTAQTLARFPNVVAMADYLKHFRADSIVRDAEWIRHHWLGGNVKWSLLGQSFGGFCVVHYLSAAPEGLKEAIITGGLPPIHHTPKEVYRATYRRVIEKNRRYYERYPDDAERAQAVVDYLSDHDVYLPTGDPLSPRRFQQLGMGFGASDGFEQAHYLLEGAFVDTGKGQELSYNFLRELENTQSFDTNPIYAILHEASFCEQTASRWAAERVRAEYPEFQLEPGKPVLFTGEMIYPWMFDDFQQLRPLKQAAQILAEFQEWPSLYDTSVLQANVVPAVAAIYYDDMYVDRGFSEETAQIIKGLRVWVTNEYEHNGLRAEGDIVLSRLLDMLHGKL
jgi:pimeloyl-ACP methyl ester carboxylesterase